LIISKILQKHNEVQIYSDDELLFTCTSNFVTDHRLFVGAEVANIENLQYEATLSLLESKLLGYCSKQLVNRHKANMQLKKYAQKMDVKINENDIHAITDKFQSLYIINDEKYLKSKIEKYIALKKGANYIVQKLSQEGINRAEILESINAINSEGQMESNLKSILEKKKSILEKKYTGFDLRRRLINYGISSGFTMEQIKGFINSN